MDEIIYERLHAGVALSPAELASLTLDNSTSVGYFSKAAIVETIKDFRNEADKPEAERGIENRPGIRVYRARLRPDSQTLRSVVAVAVKADGFDAQPFGQRNNRPFRRSHRLTNSGANANLREIADNQLTFNEAFELSRDAGLSAFFSETMLAPLLNDPNIDGITFYEVPLDQTPKDRFAKPEVGMQTNLTSYLAVGTTLDGGLINHDPARLTNNVLSDLPCPGYCLSLQAASGPVANTSLDFNGAPYLIRWQKT